MAAVNQEMCKTWEKTGKSEFLKLCKSRLLTDGNSFESTAGVDIKRAVYDLSWLALKGALKIEQLVNTFIDLADIHPEVPSLLADIIAILGTG